MSGQLNVSVAGTISHAGCILVGIIPPLPVDVSYTKIQPTLINTILSGPHAFLHANEATSVLLDIPWYCNTDYDCLDVDNSPGYLTGCCLNNFPASFATLVFLVLNPLQPSTGASTSLTIVIEANLTNLEVAVPTPRYVTYTPQSYFSNLGTSLMDSAAGFAKTFVGDAIDGIRGAVKYYTGLHNPNVSQLQTSSMTVQRNRLNNIDTLQNLEVLDPNANFSRIVQEPIFNTDVDEMAINNIVQKKQYIGTFKVNIDDGVGVPLFSRPISPYQGGLQGYLGADSDFHASIANNIEALHLLTRAWKGDIKITIQAVMNNKQQVKLRLLQLYNPSYGIFQGVPDYNTILQAPSHLLEFSAGGQTQEVVLPYLARNEILLNARESNAEAFFHGMYYIYVAQPLANSQDSPHDIFFNVYISLEPGATFFGYTTETMFCVGPYLTYQYRDVKNNDNNNNNNNPFNSNELADMQIYKPQSITMNQPQPQQPLEGKAPEMHENTRLLPLVDVRPIIRRLYHMRPFDGINAPSGFQYNVAFRLEEFMGEAELHYQIPESAPCCVVSRMYYGKTIGLKLRFTIRTKSGDDNPKIRIYFIPPQNYPFKQGNNILMAAGLLLSGNIGYNMHGVGYPLTNTKIPILNMSGLDKSYEFIVPNVSPLKFIGGPGKMVNQATDFNVKTASSDFGNIMICITPKNDSTYEITPEVGFTDETRLGFHCIAPLIQREIDGEDSEAYLTPTSGRIDSNVKEPLIELNRQIYYTRR